MAGQPAAGVIGGCGCGEAVSGTQSSVLASLLLGGCLPQEAHHSPPRITLTELVSTRLQIRVISRHPSFLARSLLKADRRQDCVCRQGFLEAQQGAGKEDCCFLGDGGWSAAGSGAQSPGSLYEDMESTPEFPPSEGQHPPASRLEGHSWDLKSPAPPSGLACNQGKAGLRSGKWDGPRLPPTVDTRGPGAVRMLPSAPGLARDRSRN